MKKFYSLVLMATALLIGTNVWAENVIQLKKSDGTIITYPMLQTAFENADDGSTITLLDNYTMDKHITHKVNKTTVVDHQGEFIDLGNGDGNGTSKSITLDLAGKTISSENNYIFKLYSGALNIVDNSVEKGGTIQNTYNSGIYYTIQVFGSIKKDIDPRTANKEALYTYLFIGEDVNIISNGEYAAKQAGIGIMIYPAQNGKFNGIDTHSRGAFIYGYEKDANGNYKTGDPRGVANGVRVDVKGNVKGALYAMQTNGQLACYKEAYAEYYYENNNSFYGAGTNVPASIDDTLYAPYIHIYKEATLSTTSSTKGDAATIKQVALYASGYARWYVEGTCEGTTGLYMKSGSVVLHDANVTSTYGSSAAITTGEKKGVNSGGNAVVVESNGHYSGNCVLNIEGDTKVSTKAEDGAALLEVIAPGTESTVEEIKINGGTLIGDNAIAISDQTVTNGKVTVYGVTAEGNADFTGILPTSVHTTVVGNTIVVSTGAAPATIDPEDPTAPTPWSWCADNNQSGKSVAWTALEDAEIASGKVTLGELQIISGTGETLGARQQLTIKKDAALVVDKLIMNDYARIIVEAGGMLIVTGTLGINAPVFENILLKSTATEQATFLFNPAVSSNKYPKATVQLASKAYKIGDNNYAWQRFAVPTHVGYEVKRNDMQYDKTNYPTAIYKRVYSPDGWEVLAPASEEAYVPFLCYNMTTNVDHDGAVYTFQCEMAGNVNAELPLLGEKWSYYGNSYTAPIDLATMIPSLPATVSKTVYVHNVGEDYWDAVNVGDIEDNEMAQTQINPMQAFVYQKRGEGTSTILDYENWVYEPAKVKANLAPARRVSSSVDYQRATIVMTAEDGSQEIAKLYQGARFANTYDDGYDAEKLMSENHFNMYINAEEGEMTRWATDEIENATINMQTKQATSYTMSFKNVTLEGYAVKDNLTGTTVEIMNGNTYHFSTLANANVEGRFEIVGRQNMPTAIDNTEAVKSVKGIYTITGQYVGEENVWNTLPAGVYVVNGMKMVK